MVVKDLIKIFKNIASEGISILFVEQNVRLALSMADRGYVLESGRLVISGNSEDLIESDSNGADLPILESTQNYCTYIKSCPEDLLYAHVYVRYLGDLKGGQMIASRVPGKGLYYKFEDPEALEHSIRINLREDEDFVEESKKCFTFATQSFEDLKKYIEEKI